MTPNRSAGRIGGLLWQAFLDKCHALGISNTDGQREMIRGWTGYDGPEEDSPPATDSG